MVWGERRAKHAFGAICKKSHEEKNNMPLAALYEQSEFAALYYSSRIEIYKLRRVACGALRSHHTFPQPALSIALNIIYIITYFFTLHHNLITYLQFDIIL